jgi:hypothetical protein
VDRGIHRCGLGVIVGAPIQRDRAATHQAHCPGDQDCKQHLFHCPFSDVRCLIKLRHLPTKGRQCPFGNSVSGKVCNLCRMCTRAFLTRTNRMHRIVDAGCWRFCLCLGPHPAWACYACQSGSRIGFVSSGAVFQTKRLAP